jgi:hypothetical protein
MSESAEAFVQIINTLSYQGKNVGVYTPLTNLTFFLGAGFSKSWEPKYPTGTELFSFNIEKYSDDLYEFIDNIGFTGLKKFDFSSFKDVAYQLSMQKKYPAIRSRYIDLYNISMIENEISAVITKRFQEIVPINYIAKRNEKLQLPEKPTDNQKNIVEFFRWMNDHFTGDGDGIPEGVRPHFITTNYDFLIESIYDTILGQDDTQLNYTYRGFTPFTTNGGKNARTVFKHWLVQNLIKINGGFEIYDDSNGGFALDYRIKTEKELKTNAPVLIVPNREQDYTGNYFQTIFPKAVRLLQDSTILVIVGYSLPEEDALLRILLRQFAEENADGSEKIIFFINPMKEAEQDEKLKRVFPYHDYSKHRYNIFTYSGFFTDWVSEVLDLIKANHEQ